jgi:SAM-dependent methyltransferase
MTASDEFYGELTGDLLRRAGIAPGMRVVDVGCGTGDVSLIVASLVGEKGSVIGVDRSAESVQLAQLRGGVEVDMGSRLFATFRDAGLPAPALLLQGRIERAADSPAFAHVADTIRGLLPMAERLGVVTPRDVDVGTLADCLRDDVVRVNAVVVLPHLIGAWTRLPAQAT